VSLTAAVLTSSSCVLKKPPDTTAIKGEAMPWSGPHGLDHQGERRRHRTDNWLATFQDEH
jgi:hypothetical protein